MAARPPIADLAWARDPEALAERQFAVSNRDGLVLVTPSRAKYDWKPEELWLRSAVFDSDGRVASLGWPKFFNLGENADDSARLERALEAGEEVWLTEKMDGSLCIRSVIGGSVIFRTRGTTDGGAHGPAMRACAAANYPQLLDPAFAPEGSLLFEFTSPRFRIVLPYTEPDLTFLGAVSHVDASLSHRDEVEAIAREGGLKLVEERELPRDIGQMAEVIRDLEGSEGIVARCAGGQTMVKVKAASYLAAHAILFAFSPRRVAELCLEHDIRDEQAFRAKVRELAGGYDFELEEEVLGHFRSSMVERERIDTLLSSVSEWVAANRHLDRKSFALAARDHAGPDLPLYFSVLDGRPEKAREYLEKRLPDKIAAERDGRDFGPVEA